MECELYPGTTKDDAPRERGAQQAQGIVWRRAVFMTL
jgi:hypothetical protein